MANKYNVTIISANEGDDVRHAVLKVVGHNVRGVPNKFELIEDEQETNVESGDAKFVVAIVPARMFDGTI